MFKRFGQMEKHMVIVTSVENKTEKTLELDFCE